MFGGEGEGEGAAVSCDMYPGAWAPHRKYM